MREEKRQGAIFRLPMLLLLLYSFFSMICAGPAYSEVHSRPLDHRGDSQVPDLHLKPALTPVQATHCCIVKCVKILISA